ncbi:hypothetical protein LSAT2_016493, partial [Lamellibrachia satsuma]
MRPTSTGIRQHGFDRRISQLSVPYRSAGVGTPWRARRIPRETSLHLSSTVIDMATADSMTASDPADEVEASIE